MVVKNEERFKRFTNGGVSMSDFPKGFFLNKPSDRAPDFIKGKLNIKIKEAVDWLSGLAVMNEEWVTLDLKESREGKYYASINDFKPNGRPKDEGPMPEEDSFEIPGEMEMF